MILTIMCWIGVAVGAAAAVKDGGEIESLTVFEGENLTITNYIDKWDEDPHVLVFRLKPDSSLDERIAEFFCHKKACKQRYWQPGVSLTSDGENITLVLMHIKFNQTGLYRLRNQINRKLENRIYNVTVYQPSLSSITLEKTASAPYSGFTAEMKAVTVSAVLMGLLVFGIIGAITYWKHREPNVDGVPR